MATKQRSNGKSDEPRRPPAKTPEAREKQLIGLAVDEAERQIRTGTASSQVLSHFLKLGSSTGQLQNERLEKEIELAAVKMEAIESHKKMEVLYGEALNAMRSYAGQDPLELEPGED